MSCEKKCLTIQKVFDGQPDPLVKGPGVGRGLEGEAELFVAGLPMVEGRHDFVVLEILLDCAAQDNLKKIEAVSMGKQAGYFETVKKYEFGQMNAAFMIWW